MASPIVPTNHSDPTGTKRAVAGAENSFEQRLNVVFNNVNQIIKELQYDVIAINNKTVVINQLNVNIRYKYNETDNFIENIYVKRPLKTNESIYNYNINPLQLTRLNETIADMITRLFMVDTEGNILRADNARQLWFMSQYVEPQYIRGTNQAFTNLTLQSDIYASAVSSLEQIMFSEPYQTRIGFVAGREFELMEGFTDDVIKETRLILGDGIGLGKSPREISKQLRSRINVSKSRANTIARTEITGALRRANRAEGNDASIRYGIKTTYLWMASFLPNTRNTHISRSGNYHTSNEDEDFYGKNGNAINCRCTQLLTVLDNDGNPISDLAQKKVQKMKDRYQGRS